MLETRRSLSGQSIGEQESRSRRAGAGGQGQEAGAGGQGQEAGAGEQGQEVRGRRRESMGRRSGAGAGEQGTDVRSRRAGAGEQGQKSRGRRDSLPGLLEYSYPLLLNSDTSRDVATEGNKVGTGGTTGWRLPDIKLKVRLEIFLFVFVLY